MFLFRFHIYCETYSHPNGPQTQTLSFALLDHLLHPEGNVAIALLLMQHIHVNELATLAAVVSG